MACIYGESTSRRLSRTASHPPGTGTSIRTTSYFARSSHRFYGANFSPLSLSLFPPIPPYMGKGVLPKNTFKPPIAPPSPKKCPKRILRSNLSLTASVWLSWCLRFGPSPWPSPLRCPPSTKELLSTIPEASAQLLLEIQTSIVHSMPRPALGFLLACGALLGHMGGGGREILTTT